MNSPAPAGSRASGFRLVAADLDGTLLDGQKRIADDDREALERADREEIRIALISGRRYAEMELLTVDAPESVYLAGHGGALIRRRGVTIAETLLPRAAAAAALSAARRLGMIALVSGRDGEVRITAPDPGSERVRRYLATVRPPPAFVAEIEFAEDPIHVVLAGTPEDCRLAERELRERLDGAAALDRTEYPAPARSAGLGLLDVLGPGADKGAALRRIAEDAGVGLEETLAIGDNWNDLSMLRTAGKGVLMANAPPELRELDFDRTTGHTQCGVARALERFVFAAEPAGELR